MNQERVKLTPIETGFFKLDGGAMFGIVPRRMWEKLNPPDEKNLCTWALRCLLVETGDQKILIDTGMGSKQDAKFRSHFEPHGEQNLMDSLQKAGVSKEEITDVFLTHLHFDHCGGAVERTEFGDLQPVFPSAKYWSNRAHFDWAIEPNAREKASFLKENFRPLESAGVLNWVETGRKTAIFPHFHILFVNGHTEQMMLPMISANGKTVVFCADLLPSQWHVPMPWVMAYDIRPLDTLAEKEPFLELAAAENWILFFEHDPQAECATVRKDESGRIVVEKVGRLAEFL